MLQKVMDSYAIFWAAGVIMAVDIIGKMVRMTAWRRLVRSAARMGKSTHALMKLVKAKFEHNYMLSNGVDNIGAFVDKYLHEYKIMGLRLQSWRYLEKQNLWICGILGCIGAAVSYRDNGMQEVVFQYIGLAAVTVTVLFLLRVTMEEELQLGTVRMYMIDYLENICAPRYQKQRELQSRRMEQTIRGGEALREVEEEPEDSVTEEQPVDIAAEESPQKTLRERAKEAAKESQQETAGKAAEENCREAAKEEKRVPQEVILREILEEFLA